MNWLIYIGGWMLGWFFFNSYIKLQEGNSDYATAFKLVTWTLIWMWVCWKFIH
jgi:hypothetical protein